MGHKLTIIFWFIPVSQKRERRAATGKSRSSSSRFREWPQRPLTAVAARTRITSSRRSRSTGRSNTTLAASSNSSTGVSSKMTMAEEAGAKATKHPRDSHRSFRLCCLPQLPNRRISGHKSDPSLSFPLPKNHYNQKISNTYNFDIADPAQTFYNTLISWWLILRLLARSQCCSRLNLLKSRTHTRYSRYRLLWLPRDL